MHLRIVRSSSSVSASDNSSISSITESPTSSPTEYFVRDYKLSAQNANHSDWVSCDGSHLDSDTYRILFSAMGYSFGSFHGDSTIFGLPDSTDKILGVYGSNHLIWEI